MKSTSKICIVVPNLNGMDSLRACLDSLLAQSQPHDIIVVENGSVDDSAAFLSANYPTVKVLPQAVNLGFAGGVNVGLRYAIQNHYEAAALFNNDAVAEPDWLRNLVRGLEDEHVGIATGTLMTIDKLHVDSTGDLYTTWGLPYPRGRGEAPSERYNEQTAVFGASGGASLYRLAMLKQIGLFDEDFFAYYEDIDISFRAQLAGWGVRYVPSAIAYHQIGATSSRMKGFTVYQTIKNYPWLAIKNLPGRFLPVVLPRLALAQCLFIGRAFQRGLGWYAMRGLFVAIVKLPKKLAERRHIQRKKVVSDQYIWSIMTHDLPPNARALRQLRSRWWQLIGKA